MSQNKGKTKKEKRYGNAYRRRGIGGWRGSRPFWKSLYQAGGACALFYVVFGMLVPEVLFSTPPNSTSMSVAATLHSIASHQGWFFAVGWKLSRLGTQRGSLLSPSNKVKL